MPWQMTLVDLSTRIAMCLHLRCRYLRAFRPSCAFGWLVEGNARKVDLVDSPLEWRWPFPCSSRSHNGPNFSTASPNGHVSPKNAIRSDLDSGETPIHVSRVGIYFVRTGQYGSHHIENRSRAVRVRAPDRLFYRCVLTAW